MTWRGGVGDSRREEISVHSQLIHFIVQQKLMQNVKQVYFSFFFLKKS